MKRSKAMLDAAGLALVALVFAAALAADVMAQTSSSTQTGNASGKSSGRQVEATANAAPAAVRTIADGTAVQRASGTGAEDMRLWSFGDCERRFPYVNSDEHKECVRVVGSAEARDARAFRVCAVSHEKDPAEIERCRATYQGNKEKAAEDGVVPDAPALPRAAPPPEVMKRVRAIATAAADRDKAEAMAAAPPADAEEPAAEDNAAQGELSSSMSTIGMLSLGLLVLGLGATLARRKMAGSAS